MVLSGLFVLGVTHAASAQQSLQRTLGAAPAVAIVNVNLIRMDHEGVESDETVVVQGDRIAAIGASGEVAIPEGAMVIDGAHRYLLRGLTDAHVHLAQGMPWAPTRPDFGDAPLYLAYGVTTVVNLGGTPALLEWRQRIATGDLLGPTIYTSGPFVNEPRVNTPEEVQREVVTQARQGYDLIKFHELPDTATGLSLAAYLKMNESAREVGIPLVGHAPVKLGLDVMLQARQSLAHMGMLGNIYFLPLQANFKFLAVTATVITPDPGCVHMGWRGNRRLATADDSAPPSAPVPRANRDAVGPAGRLGWIRIRCPVLPRLPATASCSVACSRPSPCSSQSPLCSCPRSQRGCGVIRTRPCPVSWRSTDSGIARVAQRLHDAGIWVQTTLVVYESMSTPARLRLIQDPIINYLRPEARALWHGQAQAGIPGYRYDQFMKKVTGALHRAGVPLMAGTDAMGLPLVAPGTSLRRELELLIESGLTPYEAIRSATVAPAVFLRKDNEFGSIGVGKRADLLLLEENPLQGIAHLKQLVGVMVRGKWLPIRDLHQMLEGLPGRE